MKHIASTMVFTLAVIVLGALFPRASSANECIALWIERNSIFHEAGYCFGSDLGSAYFDNRDCYTKSPNIDKRDKQRVEQIIGQEQKLGCADQKKHWSVADIRKEALSGVQEKVTPQKQGYCRFSEFFEFGVRNMRRCKQSFTTQIGKDFVFEFEWEDGMRTRIVSESPRVRDANAIDGQDAVVTQSMHMTLEMSPELDCVGILGRNEMFCFSGKQFQQPKASLRSKEAPKNKNKKRVKTGKTLLGDTAPVGGTKSDAPPWACVSDTGDRYDWVLPSKESGCPPGYH